MILPPLGKRRAIFARPAISVSVCVTWADVRSANLPLHDRVGRNEARWIRMSRTKLRIRFAMLRPMLGQVVTQQITIRPIV
jgi:hypothetical protein